MASFMTDLWESIFTPGPTPVLLKAANASFAALQLVLFLLLIGTYSIHFAILSVLCAGLWTSINWFATELAAAQAREAAEAAVRKKDDDLAASASGVTPAATSADDSDTETEEQQLKTVERSTRRSKRSGVVTTDVEPAEQAGELKLRGEVSGSGAGFAGTQSSVSTEDEWEKVSENEQEKDQ
jgi:hypothetical protein